MKRSVRLALIAFVSVTFAAFASSALDAGLFPSKKSGSHAQDENVEDFDDVDVRTRVPLVGEFTTVHGQEMLKLEGAGLVVGLDGTGEDPPPSPVRQMVLDDMKRRGIAHPNKILKSNNIAVVIVTAYVPPLVRKGDRFDVEVRVPDGSKVRSLNGGWLMPTYLAEHLYIPKGGWHESFQLATATGPILVSAAHESSVNPAGLLRRGIIVAGGISKMERNLSLYLRSGFRSERNAVRIANAVGRRFYEYDKYGQRVTLAEAKTNQKIELKVLSKYRDNFPRYLDVVRRIAFRESDIGRQLRLQALKNELLNAETAAEAALELEAIGDPSVPVLKAGLRSKDEEVRFHAAVALAYLGNASGLDVLTDAARNVYAFRVFALAAMSCLDDPEVPVRLRELMNVDSAETRYGAFRALTTLDKNDPFVRGQKINDEFRLHVLSTLGPPMVHITNRRKVEVVLFGSEQRLLPPVAARAGTRIMVTAPQGENHITVTRFDLGRDDQRKVVSTRLADVILAMTELGATFPDVAQFLAEVNAQKNLQGRLEIDALPQAGRYYERKGTDGSDKTDAHNKRRVGNSRSAPNLFSIETDKANSTRKSTDDEGSENPKADGLQASRRGKKRGGEKEGDGASSRPTEGDGGVVTADLKSADDPAAGSHSNQVKPAGHEQPADADGKGTGDGDGNAQKLADSNGSSSGFFGRVLRLFDFGRRAPSGNKEP